MFNKIIVLLSLSFCGVRSVDVKTSSGLVRGHTVNGINNTAINEFLNIPYAEPPIGNLRFAKPVPLKEPKSIIDGTKLGVSCFQYGHSPKVPVSEDCLILNIWSPVSHNSSDLKPVMFWIHGGGFYGGSSVEGTNGTFIASNDVVMVTINYRLGPFGFLYGGVESAPGNVGLYDQNMALKWVKQNIHSFGGNPNEITIFGESAGSWSVSSHVLSPVSKGLFKRAILQSGAIFNDKNAERLPKASALRLAKVYAKHFNCTEDNQWLECMRKVGAKELNGFVNLQPYAIHETEFLPLIAQKAFKAHNYSTDIDIIAGIMQREGSSLAHGSLPQSEHLKSEEEFKALAKRVYFPELNYDKITEFYLKNVNTSDSVALKKAFYEFYGDIYITCPTYHFAKQFAEYSPKRNAFFYEFTYPVSPNDMGATHGSDVGLVFGYPAYYKSHDKQFSEDLLKMWTNFAKYGQPLKGFPSDHIWPRFIESTGTGATKTKEMNPAQPNHIIDNIFANTCDGFWKNYFV